MKPTTLNANKKINFIKTPHKQQSQKKARVCPVIQAASFTRENSRASQESTHQYLQQACQLPVGHCIFHISH